MALTVTEKCDQASSLHQSVKSTYSAYYTDQSGGVGQSTVVQALVTCSAALDTNITAIKVASLGAVQGQLGNTNSLLVGGNMSCSLDRFLDVSSIFEKWADGLKAISDGRYLDQIIEALEWCLEATRSSDELTSKICDTASKSNDILNKLNQLAAILAQFPATLNELANQLGVLSLAQACDKILTKLYSLRPSFGEVNPNVATSLDVVDEAKNTLGAGASKGDIASYAKGRYIEESGTATTLSSIGSQIDARVTALNT